MPCAPHPSPYGDTFPPKGKAWKEEKLIFDLYRLADARHFPRRGKQGERLKMEWRCYLKY